MGRNKTGKPRRKRPEPETHAHSGFEIPADYPDPEGRTVDYPLIGQIIGAAYDGCTTCQDPLITLLTEDPNTTARVVEMACIAIQEVAGGLPAALTDPDAPGIASQEFRQLARAGLDGNTGPMWRQCHDMTPRQRRDAADTALNLLVGAI